MDPELKALAVELKDAHETVKQTHAEMKKVGDRVATLEEKGSHVPADLKQTLAQVQTALATSDEKHVKLLETVEGLSKKVAAVNAQEDVEGKADLRQHQIKFFEMMRKGVTSAEHAQELATLQMKTMFASSDPDGGYVIPRGTTDRIITTIKESSPVRQLATIITIGGEDYKYLLDLDDVGAGWVSERGSRPKTDTAKVQIGNIPAHEMYANPFVTQKQLDDASFDLEGWLNGKVANRFGRLEATAFVLGDGIGKPRGFLTYANGTAWKTIEQIKSGHATVLTADSLITLQNALKSEYAGEAVFAMKRQTVAAVRTLKDATSGAYLWQPGLQAGEPATLLGDPIVRMSDMPAVGAGTLPVAYGNFREGYTIVDRQAIRVLRDPYSNKPYVEFYTTKRVGGDVTNFEALKLLVIGA